MLTGEGESLADNPLIFSPETSPFPSPFRRRGLTIGVRGCFSYFSTGNRKITRGYSPTCKYVKGLNFNIIRAVNLIVTRARCGEIYSTAVEPESDTQFECKLVFHDNETSRSKEHLFKCK
ncbi:hypothetical protein PUN28_004822 [Cardiocondyla obscurior]|uniref:Uncharacterized protein n=1 Tax=Cardiocondyla obscurior TaxID=286306 RepID=A0AAW2GEH9_9HYME